MTLNHKKEGKFCKRIKVEITSELVTKLILEQFPQLAHFTIKPVEFSGNDNRTFRLGNEMLIRMPSAQSYALQVKKEHKWLPILSRYLSHPIPKPLAIGQPSHDYPWNWSIYSWLPGESANTLTHDQYDLNSIAIALALFLKELHKVDIKNALKPGLHNYWRGNHISIYDDQARSQIDELKDIIDAKAALSLWEKAINSKWNNKPVWIHGDLSSGNILIKDRKLSAVIDFGCIGVGDPACDLVIYWTFFKNQSRKTFCKELELDNDTWIRASGWALWKATFELALLNDKASVKAIKQLNIIQEVCNEYNE